jgi:carboxylesterase type B
MGAALVNFVNHLNPNGKSGNQWPKYSLQNPKNFVFGPGTTSVQDDTYRKKAMSVLNSVALQHPF